ncbi:DNA mismatch repair protein MutS [Clostridium aceticum]|uniref:Endonuclease MutS2 n=1 Tax=Clostridium aceticum TaxID=84022 RepID=A0A0D8ID50_9CLOT|nr:endonuclease MutS2 [Clostridium aceticum]AKL94559.1 DNA mismatch repair protein MutS [Clostridium aceticum]KJF28240.1 recombination and DNA strand exchange inhibitor protein [Clostridium aceticum]
MNEKSLRVLEYTKIIEKLIEGCASSLGKDLAKNLKPFNQLEKVQQLQKETSEAQSILIKRGNVPLGGIHDILHLVRRTEIGSYLDPGQLLYLRDTLAVARKLKQFLKEDDRQEAEYPIIRGLIQSLNTVKEIEEKIEVCVLSETEISDHASSELRNVRRMMASKNDAIRNKLNSIINSTSYQKYLQDAIVTIRQDRFVVPVKQEYRSHFPGLVHDQSSSGATVFIEPMAVVELNNQLKELKIKEKKEIERILMEISSMIAERGEEIKGNQSILQELDFIFAKGKLSLSMKAIEPALNQEGKVAIKNGRHPLLNPSEVVPTNIWLGEEFHLLVITGPNTGGKTVTLKTVGLLSMMAQSGLHVPADYGTKLAVYDHIFADIGDEQSIEQSLSTFSSHMTNIVKILEAVTPNSLVLLDELGAGTDPTEGAALAMAVLNYLKSLRTSVIATTHYSELKQYALLKDQVENASVEFDVETLRPTYKLLIGVPGKSNAFEISKKLGLSNQLIEEAKTLLTKENIEFEDLLQNIEKNRVEAEKEKNTAASLRLQAEATLDSYLEKKDRLEQQREKILKEAKKEAYKIVKEAKQEAEEVVENLRKLKVELEEKEINRKIQEAKTHMDSQLNNLSEGFEEKLFTKTSRKPPENLKAGDPVKVLSLNQVGHVIEPANENGEVFIQIGIMKMNIHVSNLENVNEKKQSKTTGLGKIVKSKATSAKNELDIRGKNLEESYVEVDKYLDDVYLAGLTEVTIIHGVGTGVLKAGIKQMLKKHRHVKSQRDGKYGEGGAGVTIVELK